MSCRRRPLHTWGVSAIAITHKAYMKAQALNQPLALMAERLIILTAHMVSYFLHCLQHFLLSIFFVVDDCILALENMAETVFPSSKHVFDKVDEVIEIIETLPGKFDDVLNEFPEQVPLVDWIISLAISWLKFLTRWGLKNTKEKDIVVDHQNEAKVPVESINDDEKLNKSENEVEKIRVCEMVNDQTNVNDNEKLIKTENEAEKIRVCEMVNDHNDQTSVNDNEKLNKSENEAEKIRVCEMVNDHEKLKRPENEAEKIKVSPISGMGTKKGSYKDILKSKGTCNDVLERGNRENNNMKKKKKNTKKVGVQKIMNI